MKTEDVLEDLANEGATVRLAGLPTLGFPNLGDAEPQRSRGRAHSQCCFLPLPPPLPLFFLPLPSPDPPLAEPHFDEEEDGSEKQLSLVWPGFLQKLHACSRLQSVLLQPLAELYKPQIPSNAVPFFFLFLFALP